MQISTTSWRTSVISWRLCNHQTTTNSDFPSRQLHRQWRKIHVLLTAVHLHVFLNTPQWSRWYRPPRSVNSLLIQSARPVTSSLSKALTSCVVLLASCNAWRTLSFTDRSVVLLPLLLIISLALFGFFVTAPLNAALVRRRCSICCEVHGSISSLSIFEGVLDQSPTPPFDANRRIACNSSGSKDQIVSTIRTFTTV